MSLCRKTADLAQVGGQEIVIASGSALPPGRYRCRVIIRDLETGESALGSKEVDLIKPAPAKLSLYSPLLLVPEKACSQVEAGQRDQQELPSWQKVYPYDAASFAPLMGEVSQRAGKVVAIVPFSTGGFAAANVAFSVALIDSATGQSVPATCASGGRSQAGTVEVERLELPLDQVPPGKYVLYIHAVDKEQGAQAQTHLPLVVSGSTT